MKYDYLVVGAGLFGSVFAHEANKRGKKVLVIDKKTHIAGNIYTEKIEDIHVHKYGAHIFHTSNKTVWEYVNQFSEFNHFVNAPMAIYQNKIYNLPFNMNTFNQLWGVTKPNEAMAVIDKQKTTFFVDNPKNLEEQAINLVGPEIYEKIIKGYTEKQWGKDCKELPAFIIRRLPVRFTYDNNYFTDIYQGIPKKGYTDMIENMLSGIEVRLETDYFNDKANLDALATKVLYTGPIDAFYNYKHGLLEYRSLRFEHEILDIENFQGNAVINYTERSVPYTRIIEHKHFVFGKQQKTIITKEFPDTWTKNKEAYYPINDVLNDAIYEKYKAETKNQIKYLFGGRLAEYKYYDMHIVVEQALDLVNTEFSS